MSRIGKLPINLPANTSAEVRGNELAVKGPKGELKISLPAGVEAIVSTQSIVIKTGPAAGKKAGALWGLFRNLANNMVVGVTQGYEKKLEINGVGYRATLAEKKLLMNLGYSHPIDFSLPEGINAVVAGNLITLSGINKGLLGETAARLRKLREPEPYKGKGIKYAEETIRRKASKTAAKGADK